ncbi:CoA-disulfide reductase [Ammoniphilus sp. CFH 90114]|uniref:CoA-disulfide reductase n=1 Tax=Ammoniphilus sp. CFH 90114 TaxID=2493665 RepID=UPI00100F61FE|nr:CoA-disulfide reductase [Ammoniphilus sp. CFH 90114]RXT07944.1 CoA-disulfide reductase [Ammoniphilus sp. CFH 90114]
MKKIMIVGGVAGGATTAARLRRLDETSQIILFERGEFISFANCGLPYYIGETIKERNKLLVQTVEGMSEKFNLDIRNLSEVQRINRDKKTVEVKNLATQEVYEEGYDVLVLSPGASPIVPPIPGIEEAKHVFTLRNIPDTDRIKAHVDEQKPRQAVVIGGGFIGLEMAENLVDRGIHVTLVEMANQVMAPLDYEMAAILHTHLKDKGVNLILQDGVQSFSYEGKRIILSSGTEVETDMTILSIGVKPENKLAVEAGLQVGERGGIRVNEYLQTSDESIYAIGDAIEVVDFITKQPAMIPLAGPANRQGRIVANNIYDRKQKYAGTMGTSVVKVFDYTAASTGNNEKNLKRLGIAYEVVHIHPGSHAGYYPGSHPIALKLIFDPKEGFILGAQAVGVDGADKRMDVIATAIKAGMTVFDLADLELAYAPPYSSAKDPVNMAGFVASNMIEDGMKTVQWHEIDQVIQDGGMLVDVREPIERNFGFIEGSINIPLGEIRKRLEQLPKDQTIYVSCQVGLRGYLAARILRENGITVKNLDGGWKTYSAVYGQNASPQVEVDDSGIAKEVSQYDTPIHRTINACGLSCPGPVLAVNKNMKEMKKGEVLEICATDRGFIQDVEAWCKKTGNTLLTLDTTETGIKAYIRKG